MNPIRTERLLIRPFAETDLDALHAMLSDPQLTLYLPTLRMANRDETQAFLRRAIASAEALIPLHRVLCIETVDGDPIGAISLRFLDGMLGAAHYGLGYFIRRDMWNRGYGAEAVRAACAWAFTYGAVRLSASVLAENLGSRRVLEKCGFAQEGLLKAHTWHEGAWKDCAVYRLLSDEQRRN